MGRAKDIVVKVINAKIANAFVKKNHYSGKVVNNSVLHFGCFLDGKLHGVMSYGNPLDKSKVLGIVKTSNKGKNKKWNEMLELNRMAFDSYLPRNSESRCLSISFKLIKKNAPHIKWIISFSDGTQCGDGTIYRASGFLLTKITPSKNLAQLPNGEVIHKMTLESNPTSKREELNGMSYYELTGGKYDFSKYIKETGAKTLVGYQLRYVRLLSNDSSLNCENIPFSKIDDIGAGMYKGQKISLAERKAKRSGEVESNANSDLD